MNQDFSDDTAFSGTIRLHPNMPFKDVVVGDVSRHCRHYQESLMSAERLFNNIPDEIFAAGHQLRDYALRNGWGGMTGNGLWALEGIGPVSPYHQRIYELEGRLHHVEEAYIAADRLRTEYQLQLEALTHAAERVAARCRYGDSQKTFQELVELLHEQRKTNQP